MKKFSPVAFCVFAVFSRCFAAKGDEKSDIPGFKMIKPGQLAGGTEPKDWKFFGMNFNPVKKACENPLARMAVPWARRAAWFGGGFLAAKLATKSEGVREFLGLRKSGFVHIMAGIFSGMMGELFSVKKGLDQLRDGQRRMQDNQKKMVGNQNVLMDHQVHGFFEIKDINKKNFKALSDQCGVLEVGICMVDGAIIDLKSVVNTGFQEGKEKALEMLQQMRDLKCGQGELEKGQVLIINKLNQIKAGVSQVNGNVIQGNKLNKARFQKHDSFVTQYLYQNNQLRGQETALFEDI